MIQNDEDPLEELETLRIENKVQNGIIEEMKKDYWLMESKAMCLHAANKLYKDKIKAMKEELFEIADERDKARGAAVLLLNLLKKSYWSESVCHQVSSIIKRNKWVVTK